MHLLPNLAERPAASRRTQAATGVALRRLTGLPCVLRTARLALASALRLIHAKGIWPWAWLLASVLLAQSLGQVHGVLHAGTPHGDIAAQDLANGNHHAPEALSFPGRLFGGHANPTDCRLYDQISHGDCMPTAALLPAPGLPGPTPATLPAESAPARPTSSPQARGPPLQT